MKTTHISNMCYYTNFWGLILRDASVAILSGTCVQLCFIGVQELVHRHRNDVTKELLYLMYIRNRLPEKENRMMYHD